MQSKSISYGRKVYVGVMKWLMLLSVGLTCGMALFLILYVLWKGIPFVTWELLSTKLEHPDLPNAGDARRNKVYANQQHAPHSNQPQGQEKPMDNVLKDIFKGLLTLLHMFTSLSLIRRYRTGVLDQFWPMMASP